MSEPSPHPPLSQILPSLVLGGAGFSYQTHPDPASLPVHHIIRQAFDHGMVAIDTSPFYKPSEQLLGQALAHPMITERYSRSDYILMTKVGRIASDQYDYSPEWVRKSVVRSLERLHTSYLDVVFCHDIEAVTEEDVLGAVGELLKLVQEGRVRYIGISSYRIDLLSHRALRVLDRYKRPLDVIQNWGQLTLQNSRLESEGLEAFKKAGVSCVCSSSPLAIGLLRQGGVPLGRLGDFHPAPPGLRKAAQELADYIDAQGESLASLALRYAMWRAHLACSDSFRVCTITGISSLAELSENAQAAKDVLGERLAQPILNSSQVEKDQKLFDKAHAILGAWVDWTFTIPQEGWSTELKRVVSPGLDEDGSREKIAREKGETEE